MTNTKDWKNLFDEKLPPDADGYNHVKHESLKDLISNLLDSSRKEIEDKVKELIITSDTEVEFEGERPPEEIVDAMIKDITKYQDAYNNAISQVLELFKEHTQ